MLVPPLSERRRVVDKICKSPDFSGVSWAAPLLRHLADHPGVEGQAHRTSEALLKHVFSRIEKTPKYDIDAVRGRVKRLGGFLERFYATEAGAQLPWRVSLPRAKPGRDASAAHWDLHFEPQGATVSPAAKTTTDMGAQMLRFWEGFLVQGTPTRLVYGEPMFFCDANRSRFTRDVRRNYPKQLRPGQHAEYAFVTLGDLRFLLQVQRFLSARGVSVNAQGCLYESHIDSLDEKEHIIDRENLIVIGTPRSNGAFNAYQAGDFPLPFIITEEAVTLRDDELRDGPHPGKGGVVLAHGILTRRPSLRSTGAVLLVASNHGRAIQKIGEILTSPHLFSEFLAKPGLEPFRGQLPTYFQVAMRFEISDQGRFVNSYEILDVWDGTTAQLAAEAAAAP